MHYSCVSFPLLLIFHFLDFELPMFFTRNPILPRAFLSFWNWAAKEESCSILKKERHWAQGSKLTFSCTYHCLSIHHICLSPILSVASKTIEKSAKIFWKEFRISFSQNLAPLANLQLYSLHVFWLRTGNIFFTVQKITFCIFYIWLLKK